jgi:uncharacterized phage infection (PIP) family protein YhgE
MEGGMKTSLPIAVLLTAMEISGCASPCQHMKSTEETEASLQTVRSRKNALEQEIKSLRDLNEKLIANADSAGTEVRHVIENRGVEQEGDTETIKGSEQRLLEQKMKDLAAQNRLLQDEYDQVKGQNKTLKATVIQYQKELKELQQIPSFTDRDLARFR